MNSRGDGFLSRWAKRKADVREIDEREAALQPHPGEGGDPAPVGDGRPTGVDEDARDEPPDDETRQRWVEELEAIDIETLSYDNDFTIFMKSWVPGPLRQRALRKLWTTNPALAVLDGLNDYDLDYTDAAMQAGKVVSSYVPGQGYATVEEVAEKLSRAAGHDDDDDEQGASEDDLPEFEAEQQTSLDDEGTQHGDHAGETETADAERLHHPVDETAIAEPQIAGKLKT